MYWDSQKRKAFYLFGDAGNMQVLKSTNMEPKVCHIMLWICDINIKIMSNNYGY
jgi:hypothetical protein